MVVPNEFGDEVPIKSDADAGDLWRNAVMQHACLPRGLQGREMQGTKRQKELGCGAKVRLKRDYF